MRILVLLLCLACPALGVGQGWAIDQPHRYIILNGEYIELPVEERETDSQSLLSSLNPMNLFQKFWDSLPSLSFLNRPEEPNASENAVDTSSSGIGFEHAQESAPVPSSVPFSNYFSNPAASLPMAGIGDFFGFGGFMKKNSHSVKRRSVVPRNIPSLAQKRQTEHTLSSGSKYYYKSLGQGSFMRYEVPMAHQPGQGQGSIRGAIPTGSYNPYGSKYNPKLIPQYTKPYFGAGSKVTTTTPTTTTASDLEDPFPCPKVGLWTYENGMCRAVQALPPWGCKPIDLAQSGKLVMCRDKVFY